MIDHEASRGQASPLSPGGNLSEGIESLSLRDSCWHDLVAHSPAFILVLDREYRIRFANHTDSGATSSRILGKPLDAFCQAEHQAAVRSCIDRVFETGKPARMEGVGLRVDHQEHWYESHFGPILEEGSVVAVSVVALNATARKLTERALQVSEERFRKVFEEGPLGVSLVGLDTRLEHVNQRLCEMLGYCESEILAIGIPGITHPEDRERDGELSVRLRRGEIPHYTIDKRYVRRDGTVIWGRLTASMMHDGQGRPTSIIGMLEDISERKAAEVVLQEARETLERRIDQRTAELSDANRRLQQECEERTRAEAALRQSHDELRAIYDGLVDGLLIADLETGQCVRVNSSMCRMMGYTKEEFPTLSMKDVHPPEAMPALIEKAKAHMAQPAAHDEDIPMLRKDKSVFYADITSNRIVYDGRPCILSFFRDVTERKRGQEALARERQTLWRMLRSSDHERQLIAYEIHDELAQQLAAAIMQFQTHDFLHSQKEADKAGTAYQAGVEMVRQAYLEARRLISGVRPPILDEAGVEAAIAHLVHDHRTAGGPSIDFHSDVSFDRLPRTLENAVYRIAQEALANACKHSRSERVSMTLSQARETIHLEVQDWGVGFDPAAHQEDHFGLEGIRERTRLLGGLYAIESRPGQGTRLCVDLPLIEQK